VRGSPPPSVGRADTAPGDTVSQQISSFSPVLDALLLPNGQKCSEADQGFLYGEIARLVPSFSHNLGRVAAIEKYASHLRGIYDTAGKAAVTAFLEANK
jgi:hypothetical protein